MGLYPWHDDGLPLVFASWNQSEGVGLRVCGSLVGDPSDCKSHHRPAAAHHSPSWSKPSRGRQWCANLGGCNAELRIGDEVGIVYCRIVCLSSITIGAHSMLGGGSSIYDSDFHSLNWSEKICIAAHRSPPCADPHWTGSVRRSAFNCFEGAKNRSARDCGSRGCCHG